MNTAHMNTNKTIDQEIFNLNDTTVMMNIIVELPAIASVTRGLWRSVSRSSKTVYVEELESEPETK